MYITNKDLDRLMVIALVLVGVMIVGSGVLGYVFIDGFEDMLRYAVEVNSK